MRIESRQQDTIVKKELDKAPGESPSAKRNASQGPDSEVKVRKKPVQKGENLEEKQAAELSKQAATEEKLKKVLSSGSFAFSSKERQVLSDILESN